MTEKERRDAEKALRAVERCEGNCKECIFCEMKFASTQHAIYYAISCGKAGEHAAIGEDFATLRDETRAELRDYLQSD